MSGVEKLRTENKLLQARIKRAELENVSLKSWKKSKGRVLSQVKNETIYLTIQHFNKINEVFWRMLKSEMYYLQKLDSYEALEQTIMSI